MLNLKPSGTDNLFDPSGTRDYLHFAASPDLKHLYTIQSDETLRSWALSEGLVATAAGTTTLPEPQYSAHHQFAGQKLLLWRDQSVVVVDLAQPAAPRAVALMELDGLRTCAAVGDVLYVERYLSDPSGYGMCALPTAEEPQPPVTMFATEKHHGSYAAVVREQICWATQSGLELMELKPPYTVISLKLDNVCAYPQPVSAHRLAVLEVACDSRNAVVFADQEKQLKRVAVHRKGFTVRGWSVNDGLLYTVLRSSKKLGKERLFETSLVVFDTLSAAELSSTTLPFTEVYGKAATQIVWLAVKDSICAILLGNGTLHRYEIEGVKTAMNLTSRQ